MASQPRLLESCKSTPFSSNHNNFRIGRRGNTRPVNVYDLRQDSIIVTAGVVQIKDNEQNELKHIAKVYNAFEKQVQAFFIGSDKVIVLLPESFSSTYQVVLLELYDCSEKYSLNCECTVIQKTSNIQLLANLIQEKFKWRHVVICKDRRVLDASDCQAILNTDVPIRLQAIRSHKRDICLFYQPKPKVSYTYTLEIDTASTVKKVKELFYKEFADDILVRNMADDEVLHLFYHDMQLEDKTCIGIILRGNKDKMFQFHISAESAISVTLHYREERGKVKVQKYQQVSICPSFSTADLRNEAAKYLNVDPKAIKIAVDNKRIEEVDNLCETGIINKGTVLSVGIKKKKCVQVRHPKTDEDMSVNLYMLETVEVLKQMISERFDIDKFHMSLWCRGVEMKDHDRLLNYPIKNKMEVTMAIHQFRISFRVIVIFKRTYLNLVVDNCKHTTVDEILTYCANTQRYNKRFSRALFNNQCLDRDRTLADIGIQLGCTLYITRFDEPNRYIGDMIRVFQVRPDGQANPKLGNVCRNRIFYAPSGICLPNKEDEDSFSGNGPLPAGIHIDMYGTPPKLEKRRVSNRDVVSKESQQFCRQWMQLSDGEKGKYLSRAKKLYQRKFDEEQTRKKLLAVTPEKDNSHENEINVSNQIEADIENDDTLLNTIHESVEVAITGYGCVQSSAHGLGNDFCYQHVLSNNIQNKPEIDTEEDISSSDLFAVPLNDLGSVSVPIRPKSFCKNLVHSESNTTDMNDSSSSQDKNDKKVRKHRPLNEQSPYNVQSVRVVTYPPFYFGTPETPSSIISESPKSDDSSLIPEQFIPRPAQPKVLGLSDEISRGRREAQEGYKTV